MKLKLFFALSFLAVSVMAGAGTPAQAQTTITITNLTHGSYFTGFLVSAHDDMTHIFEVTTTASANLQAMAEGGALSGLTADMGGVDDDTIEDPLMGLLGPGLSLTTSIDTSSTLNTHLSIVAMILPTNDAFVGLDALELPTTPGTYTYLLNAYDAGTEANDELINGGGASGVLGIPVAPGGDGGTGGTGVTTTETNTTIHIHRGVLGDSDPTGGVSDLDSSIHRWLNPVAELILTVN